MSRTMPSYEQAMEALRLTDPDFHQKLTDTLKQITELPQKSAQQLSESLDSIADTSLYREKLTSSLSNIRDAAMESSEAFEEEASWLTHQVNGCQRQIVTSLCNAGNTVTETYHKLMGGLTSCIHSLEDHGGFLLDAADAGLLIVCFIFTAYFFYSKYVSGHSTPSRLLSKTFICFIIFTIIWFITVGVGEAFYNASSRL